LEFSAEAWLGGLNYYRNLFRAILAQQVRKIEPILFVPENIDTSLLIGLNEISVIKTKLLNRNHICWYFRKFLLLILGKEILLERLLQRHHIAIISHYLRNPGQWRKIPVAGWIPDFQHIHLSEFFSPEEVQNRTRLYNQICKSCAFLFLSSQDAMNDLMLFSPQKIPITKILRFAVDVTIPGELRLQRDLEEKYSFRGPYFFLPNQFWAHKNHMVVLKALKILKDQGKSLTVIATGRLNDARNPEFSSSIRSYIETNKLESMFRILGVVPYPELISLVYHSIAIINPSLFEGWSTTVEEAKSLGKTLILSDLNVHREQNPQRAVYFNPDSPERLASILLDYSNSFDQGSEESKMRATSTMSTNRFKEFGAMYVNIINDYLAQY